jgi:Fe-S-cluster-containing hydrogenase component 2/CRP-like cAMP-binding protein
MVPPAPDPEQEAGAPTPGPAQQAAAPAEAGAADAPSNKAPAATPAKKAAAAPGAAKKAAAPPAEAAKKDAAPEAAKKEATPAKKDAPPAEAAKKDAPPADAAKKEAAPEAAKKEAAPADAAKKPAAGAEAAKKGAAPAEKLAFRAAELGLRPGTRDAPIAAEHLPLLAPFQGTKQAGRYPGAVVLRHYRPGEVVFEQGAPGWTAFYIPQPAEVLAIREAQGAPADELAELRANAAPLSPGDYLAPVADVALRTPRPRQPSFFRRLLGGLLAPRGRAEPKPDQGVPIDGPVDLSLERLADVIFPGEVLGEMSCMHRTPRSATVRARDECWMVEMLRSMYDLLLANPKFTAQMDEVYRTRVMRSHLKNLPLFRGLNEVAIELIRRGATIERVKAGKVIFAQDDPAPDKMYVVRIGTVKVVQKTGEFERVLSYAERGTLIGEIGVLTGRRSASCVAYDHPEAAGAQVELVGISKALLEEAAKADPELARRVEAVKAERLAADAERERAGDWAASARAPEVGLFPGERLMIEDLGLLQGQKLMAIDEARCTRCDACVNACADTHADGRSRLFREGPRFGSFLVPATCRQCRDPVCMIGCPVGSIHKGKTGEIEIESWCIGCAKCARQCPYGAINMYDREGADEEVDAARESAQAVVAVVCDQCVSNGGVPSCVYACPHDAAIRLPASGVLAEYAARAGRAS